MPYDEKSASQKNQSAEKALTILEYFAAQKQPSRVTDIAGELGMNASTTLRFLTTLEAKGYIFQDPETLKYRITNKILMLANQIGETNELSEIARPFLSKLASKTGETTCLAEERGKMLVYTHVETGPNKTLVAMQRIGNIAPLHCTGIGKLILASYNPEELDSFIKTHGLKKYTANTITSKAALLKELSKIRARKYAYDDGECDDGIRCVAVPIFDSRGKIIAGISVTGPDVRMTDEALAKYLPEIVKAGAQISNLT